MKKIGMDELYLVSEIADKIEFEAPNIYDKKGNRKDQYQYGSEMLLGLFKKMYKAKKEINDLIYKVTEKKAEEMSLKELKDTFTEILKQDGVLDFFK